MPFPGLMNPLCTDRDREIKWLATCPHGLLDQPWIGRLSYVHGMSFSMPLCRCR